MRIDEQSLFYQPANTCARLLEIAQTEKVEIEETVHQLEQKRFISQELAHIEANLDQLPPAANKVRREYSHNRSCQSSCGDACCSKTNT